MTNAQALEVLTKIYKDVDNLTTYNVDVNRVYILDYIKSHIDSIKTNKKPSRSQLVEIRNFVDKYYRLYDSTTSTTWRYLYSLYSDIYTIINPHMVLNIPATFSVPDDLKAPAEKYNLPTKQAYYIFTDAKHWAENGENTVSVSYDDVTKHLKLNGRSVKAATEKPFPIGDKLVNSFYIDSIFRMLKAEKLEFVTNKNNPIVIKNDDLIVGVVCPIRMRQYLNDIFYQERRCFYGYRNNGISSDCGFEFKIIVICWEVVL